MSRKLDNNDDESSGSDYEVEAYIRPKRVRRTVNDDSADLLGNFDDEKRKSIFDGTYEDPTQNPSDNENEEVLDIGEDGNEKEAEIVQSKFAKVEDDDGDATEDDEDDEEKSDGDDDDDSDNEVNTHLSKEQLATLMRGAAKANRHVLYVTNLNFETTKEDLEAYFGRMGAVKSVRIPKKRKGGFAFVEMADLDGFQKGFQLHNTDLQGRTIKVQISEAGKKKSANKKNIIKQKNRKLAEIRNEHKTFTKSGKFYDKELKKEKSKEMLARKRWRKKPAGRPGKP